MCLAGTNKSVQCTVRTDIVDLIPAVIAFKLSFQDEEHRAHSGRLIHETGDATTVSIDGPHPLTSSMPGIWPHGRLVLDKPAYRHERPEYKDVPCTISAVNVAALIDAGLPPAVAEGFRDGWERAAQCKPALHKHNLIFEYLKNQQEAPHSAAFQISKVDLREFLACPSGDTKRMGRELKNYMLSPNGGMLLRRRTSYPEGGTGTTRWVRALQGTPAEVAHVLWIDHSQKQYHPGQRYAAANVKDYYLPGVVNFAVDMVKNCPDCNV